MKKPESSCGYPVFYRSVSFEELRMRIRTEDKTDTEQKSEGQFVWLSAYFAATFSRI
jgi:hypothetical protein